MLPILRILPVGGVFLAILLLVLALKVPGERALPPATLTARGPQLDHNEDPQWRQVAIQAALRRANELMRLRDLPDTPMRSETPAPQVTEPEPPVPEPTMAAEPPKVAGLPVDRLDTDPDMDSITGSIEESPGATIPIEIGATSSSELPVVLPEERPAIIHTPERTKPAHESRRKKRHRSARPKAPKQRPQPAPQVSFLDQLFGSLQYQLPSVSVLNQTPAHRADTNY
jgi:hypothetical protein